MQMKKSAFLFCAHIYLRSAFREFGRIANAAASFGPYLLLWDRSGNKRYGDKVSRLPKYEFDIDSVSALGLPFFRESKLIPGSMHLPLIQFARANQFDYYWFIEYDVRFTGDWQALFQHFEQSDADFIASHIMRYSNLPSWFWWKSLSHPKEGITNAEKLRSYNPIYRISWRALQHIDRMQKKGWVGHNEVLIPTLLHHAGFKLRDFGGIGEFVETADYNRFYLDPGPEPDHNVTDGGSFRYHPPCHFMWFRPRNKLYHPVKGNISVRSLLKRLKPL